MSESPISLESFRAPTPNPWKPWLIASVAALAILGIALGFMFLLGLFPAGRHDTGAKTLAATIALVGAVLSAVVTLIGIVVKYSIDDRNAQQTAVESSRNFWVAVESEKRNRIDVAIRAVDLLSENTSNTTKHQAGGALLALVSLGELELAISLLATLWPEHLVSRQVADIVLRKALLDDSDDLNSIAATVLLHNTDQIEVQNDFIWPIPDLTWCSDLPTGCRLSLVCSACEWLILELENGLDHLPLATLVLHGALADTTVAEFAVASLRPLGTFPPGLWVGIGTRMVTVREIMESLEAYPGELVTFQAQAYQERVEAAMAGREGEPPQSDLGGTN